MSKTLVNQDKKETDYEDDMYLEAVGEQVVTLLNKNFVEKNISAIASMKNGSFIVHTGLRADEIDPVIDIINSVTESMNNEPKFNNF